MEGLPTYFTEVMDVVLESPWPMSTIQVQDIRESIFGTTSNRIIIWKKLMDSVEERKKRNGSF